MTATRSGGAATSRLNAKVVGISVAAALGGFLFGFDTSVINGAVDASPGSSASAPVSRVSPSPRR